MAEFVGHSTIRSLGLLWALSLILFLLELGFASLLQRFVIAVGLITTPHLGAPAVPSNPSLSLIVLLIFFISAARAALTFAHAFIGGAAIEGFSHRIRSALIESFLEADTVKAAETLTFFNQRIYTASMAIHSAQVLAWHGVLALGLLVSLVLISPIATLLISLGVAAALLPVHAITRRVKKSASMHIDALSKIMAHLSNVFRNFLLIRLYNLQGSERDRIHAQLGRYTEHVISYHRYEGLSGATLPLLVILNVLLIAIVQNSTAAISQGLVIPYLYLSFRFALSIAPLVSNISRLNFASAEFRHVFSWWLERARVRPNHAPRPAQEEATPLRSPIGWRLKAVSFGYEGQDQLFKNFDFEIKPGSLLRVRGESGAGKSSLVRLITGEARPSLGSVEVELDEKLHSVADAAGRMRNHIGYSSTEPYLFEGTILENVTYGLKAPPRHDFLLESAAMAECQFIFGLAEQFDHRLDELGQGLSTGQKQRLSLLRALLREPKALVLDEALSNVDISTESRILANLSRIKHECTIVFISHREYPRLPADAELNIERGPHD